MSSFDVSVDSVSERWNYRVYLAKPMSMISPVESNSLWRQPAGTRSLVIMMRRICGKSRFWAWSERMSEWLTWLLLHLLFACGCYIAFCNELIAYCLTIGGLTNDVIKCSCCRPQGRTNLSPRRSHRSFEWCLATSAPEPEDNDQNHNAGTCTTLKISKIFNSVERLWDSWASYYTSHIIIENTLGGTHQMAGIGKHEMTSVRHETW